MSSTPWGTSVIFEVSSAAPDADPAWVDLSDRVLDVGQPLEIAEGRQTELVDVEPAVFSVQLRNRDDALTPGNPTSPYASWWKQGRRCRFREIVGHLGFDLFDGYLEIPEQTVRTQVPGATDSDVTMTVTGIDLVGKHRNGRTFVSTLGEHIMLRGGSTLAGYWPMGESDGPDVAAAVGGPWNLTQTPRYNGFANAPNAAPGSITYGSAGVAPADDLGSVLFDPSLSTDPFTDYVRSLTLFGLRPSTITLNAGQTLTVACWTRPGDIAADAFQSSLAISLGSSTSTSVSASVGVFEGEIFAGAGNGANWAGAVTGPVVPRDQAIPVAVRVSFSPNVLELWVRGEVYTGSLTVSSATAATFDQIEIGERYPGAVNHAQIYLGAASDWDHTDFVAQSEMGLCGLERQTTGERVATIADYAGVPASLRDIDPGQSVMQVARLAGKTAAQAWDEARDTEQGRLFAGGGRLVFHDRARIYNV